MISPANRARRRFSDAGCRNARTLRCPSPTRSSGGPARSRRGFPCLDSAGTTDSIDWDSIHRAVQEILETLTSWFSSVAPCDCVEIRPEFGPGLSSLKLPSFLSA